MAFEEQIRPQPSSSDPKEQAIRKLLEEEFSTGFARHEVDRLRTEQLHFLVRSLHNLTTGRVNKIRPDYESLLPNLVSTISIEVGSDFLKELPTSGFVVATNHLAMPKATRFNRADLEKEIENSLSLQQLSEEIEPFPIRHAAVAATIGQQYHPHEIAIKLPSPYGDVQCASEVIAIPDKIGGRFQYMADHAYKLLSTESHAYVVTYPESGTTGKRGGGGLYGVGQEKFHTGFLRLAQILEKQLNRSVPVIVIGQAFHPNKGFRSGILEPINVDTTTDAEIEGKTKDVQTMLSTLVHQLRYDE